MSVPRKMSVARRWTTGGTARAAAVLAELFGYSSFRPGQDRVIEAVTGGRDCVAVMPTGSGKTVTFQVPARMMGGTTVVVSPLIALMEDQVARARARGLRAMRVGGSEDPDLRREQRRTLLETAPELVYAAPEGLVAGWCEALSRMDVRLFAVDEAHCVERWGPEFRPCYLELGDVRAALGHPACLAVTASASPQTVRRIADVLRLHEPVLIRTSCVRSNLTLRVRPCRDAAEQAAIAAAYARLQAGSGIVYTRSREGADATAALLRRRGVAADAYHARLERGERTRVQERFLSGATRVVVATVAFGMGIDKSDVRWIVHRGLPESLDSYYQEVGRAGRDGLDADCLMVWSPSDLVCHRSLRQNIVDPRRRDEALLASDAVVRLAAGAGCRHALVAAHFGEAVGRCGDRCDACCPRLTAADGLPSARTVASGRPLV